MKNLNWYPLIKSKEEKAMKALGFIAIIFSLFLASCSSTYDASAPYDEIYASASTPSRTTTQAVTVRSNTVESTTPVEGDYYAPQYEEGDFDSEGYYDYEYSSRIKRFQDDNPGFDYYSNYYTDNYYYNGDPNYMGSNIYSGCGCCSSGVSLSLGFGWGWGYPYYGYYSPWYYPYYGWGYGYGYGYPGYWGGSYWAGYYDGYWDGYYWGSGGGYYPYPDPYPGNGTYYGPRTGRGGSSNGSNATGTPIAGQTPAGDNMDLMSQSARGVRSDANTSAVNGVNAPSTSSQSGNKTSVLDASSRGVRPDNNTAGTNNTVNEATTTKISPSTGAIGNAEAGKTEVLKPATNVNEPGTKTSATRINQPVYNKPAEAARTDRSAGATVKTGDNKTTMSPARKVQPEMKYEKPKTYTSPNYRTTPSNQEYMSPSTRESRPAPSTQSEGTTRKVYSTTPERKYNGGTGSSYRESGSTKMNSATPSQKYSSPSSSGSRSYSTPSNSGSKSYSAPSRSYSSPSFNSGSNSGGSRSGGSSGGSFGGSSGGGGSSRGGRR